MIIDGLQPLATEIDKLKLLPGNPRKGDIQAVARSLEAFGQRKPIVAITDGTVIAGNHTLQAAQSLGWTEIAVVFVEDDEAKAKAYALADNRTAELGGYDNQALADLISDVQLLDKELFAATGWNNEDLLEILNELGLQELPTAFTDPDDVPDAPPAKTVPGDVWLLGPHRVVCGDATSPTVVKDALGSNQATLVVTDPPYGIGFSYNSHDDTSNDENAQLVADVFATVTCGKAWTPGLMNLARDITRFGATRVLVWHKGFAAAGNGLGGASTWEPVLVIDPPARNLPNDYLNFTTDRVEVDGERLNALHPCPKPVALYQHLIESLTDRGSLILEPFGGSGTTLMAAHLAGRNAAVIEIDPRYVDVICKRFQEHTGIKPINQATNQEHDFLED